MELFKLSSHLYEKKKDETKTMQKKNNNNKILRKFLKLFLLIFMILMRQSEKESFPLFQSFCLMCYFLIFRFKNVNARC